MGLFGFETVDRGTNKGFSNLPRGFADHPLLAHPLICDESAAFLASLWSLLGSLNARQTPAAQLSAIASSDLYELIAAQLAHKRAIRKDKTVDEEAKAQAKERIFAKAKMLEEIAKHYRECDRFLNAMVLGSSEMSEGSGVNLLSVHASKGLEFDEVFVIDLMDGRFPNRKLMSQGGAIEEERRLFYVAVTRARENLILSYAKYDRIKKIDYVPSQFLYEAQMLKQ
ncbi:hypothetical protein AGMMS50229_16260 [Campylobacterota bacterium]|nr:hypothetical protein AGMMS50229_16260 [Campylobacterota bacterium]